MYLKNILLLLLRLQLLLKFVLSLPCSSIRRKTYFYYSSYFIHTTSPPPTLEPLPPLLMLLQTPSSSPAPLPPAVLPRFVPLTKVFIDKLFWFTFLLVKAIWPLSKITEKRLLMRTDCNYHNYNHHWSKKSGKRPLPNKRDRGDSIRTARKQQDKRTTGYSRTQYSTSTKYNVYQQKPNNRTTQEQQQNTPTKQQNTLTKKNTTQQNNKKHANNKSIGMIRIASSQNLRLSWAEPSFAVLNEYSN